MMFDLVGAASFVLDISLRALGAAAAVAVVLRLLRLRATAVLHSAWSAVLFAMLLMPVLSSIVPALPVPVPARAGDLLGGVSGTEESSPGVVGYSMQAPDGTGAVQFRGSGDSVRLPGRLPAFDADSDASHSWLLLSLLGIYVAGVLLFVGRLLRGWLLASAMIRRAKRGGPVRVDVAAQVYESSEVTVPMTVGAIRPVIVLPVTWKTWDCDTLAAVLAHEAAHVRRHDASINFAGR